MDDIRALHAVIDAQAQLESKRLQYSELLKLPPLSDHPVSSTASNLGGFSKEKLTLVEAQLSAQSLAYNVLVEKFIELDDPNWPLSFESSSTSSAASMYSRSPEELQGIITKIQLDVKNIKEGQVRLLNQNPSPQSPPASQPLSDSNGENTLVTPTPADLASSVTSVQPLELPKSAGRKRKASHPSSSPQSQSQTPYENELRRISEVTTFIDNIQYKSDIMNTSIQLMSSNAEKAVDEYLAKVKEEELERRKGVRERKEGIEKEVEEMKRTGGEISDAVKEVLETNKGSDKEWEVVEKERREMEDRMSKVS